MRRIDWVRVRSEYVNDASSTMQSLADKHQLKVGTVRCRATRERWSVDRAQKNARLLGESTRKSVLDAAGELARFNERDLMVAKALRSLAAKKIEEAQGTSPLQLEACDIRALAAAVESAQRVARLALGASTSNEVAVAPMLEEELDLSQLSNEEFAALQQLLIKAKGKPPAPPGSLVQ